MNPGLLLAAGGSCLCEIIVPPEPTAVEKFAKDELERYLSCLTISDRAERKGKYQKKTVIRFLREKTKGKYFLASTDHFNITFVEGEVHIKGSGRAFLYAVYHLLEYFGARFYFPPEEDVVLPKTNQLRLPFSYNANEEATLPYRAIDLECILPRDKKLVLDHIDWMGKNRFNMLCTHPENYGEDLFDTDLTRWKDCEPFIIPELKKRGIVINMNVHTAFFFLPPEKYFTDHRDWYSVYSFSSEKQSKNEVERSWCAPCSRRHNDTQKDKLDFYLSNIKLYFEKAIDSMPLVPDNNISSRQRLSGLSLERGMEIPSQICYSNKGGLQTYYNNIKSYLRTQPFVNIIGLWPTDMGRYCQCKNCASDPHAVLKAVISIANRLIKEFPEIAVEYLVYSATGAFPPPENMILPKNLIILQATGNAEIIRAWLNKCKESKNMGMYKICYGGADNFQQSGHVLVNPMQVVDDYNHLCRHGFNGVDIMYIDMYSYWRSCHNLSFFAKLVWDRKLSSRDYWTDFCKRYYGASQLPLEKIYKQLQKLDREALFKQSSAGSYKKNSEILFRCFNFIEEAKETADKKGETSLLKSRLDKMHLYLTHLQAYNESTVFRSRAHRLIAEKKIKDAAGMMHKVALKEEEIKRMCMDSYYRGDGVLDLRLTVALRKFSRFADDIKLIERILTELKIKDRETNEE
jgi:hypothetical protein